MVQQEKSFTLFYILHSLHFSEQDLANTLIETLKSHRGEPQELKRISKIFSTPELHQPRRHK